MGLLRKKRNTEMYRYSEKDQESVEHFLEELFGEYDNVHHDLTEGVIHADVLVFKPNERHDYWILATCGMGAYRMNVPEVMQQERINRAELMIALPKQWDVSSTDSNFYWPVKLLKLLAALPAEENSWLGYGHTVDVGCHFSDNCPFSGAILTDYGEDDVDYLQLENDDKLIIYSVIPLLEEEIAYKAVHDAESLFDKLFDDIINMPVDIKRSSVL